MYRGLPLLLGYGRRDLAGGVAPLGCAAPTRLSPRPLMRNACREHEREHYRRFWVHVKTPTQYRGFVHFQMPRLGTSISRSSIQLAYARAERNRSRPLGSFAGMRSNVQKPLGSRRIWRCLKPYTIDSLRGVHIAASVLCCATLACVISASPPWAQSNNLRQNALLHNRDRGIDAAIHGQFASLKHCKIFILDVTRFYHLGDGKRCVRDEEYHRSLKRTMMMDSLDNGPDSMLDLQIQQHGWTRLLSHEIIASTLAAVDIDDADVMLVDMSCFADDDILKWGGYGAYKGLSGASGALSQLMRTPAWRATNGTGFVFMAPHPYSYLGLGKHGPCGLRNSYFLAAEPNQMCTAEQARENMTIVPYNSIAHTPTMDQIEKTKRVYLAVFRGTCNGNASGKRLRALFEKDIAASGYAKDPRVIVQCRPTENFDIFYRKDSVIKGQKHAENMLEMTASDFCIIIAGDTPSSRRISEAIVTGCIPVIVGPPWHTLPLPNRIPWDKIALFFEIRNASRWPSAGDEDTSISTNFNRDAIKFGWLAVPANAIKYVVDEPREVVHKLDSLSAATVATLRSRVIAHRPTIMYGGHEPGRTSLAPLAIADDICAYGKKSRVRDAWQKEKMRLAGEYLLSTTQ